MERAERGVVLYKRWRLRDGVTTERVRTLVTDRILPHYRTLSDQVVLGLEALDETTVLAIQRWPDRATLDAATSGSGFEEWWRAYRPILAEWDAATELEEEWECAVLI